MYQALEVKALLIYLPHQTSTQVSLSTKLFQGKRHAVAIFCVSSALYTWRHLPRAILLATCLSIGKLLSVHTHIYTQWPVVKFNRLLKLGHWHSDDLEKCRVFGISQSLFLYISYLLDDESVTDNFHFDTAVFIGFDYVWSVSRTSLMSPQSCQLWIGAFT